MEVAFNAELRSANRQVVDSGGSRNIVTDEDKITDIQLLKILVTFRFLKGNQSASKLGIRYTYVPRADGSCIYVDARVSFLLDVGNKNISIYSTGQGMRTGIGFYQVPYGEDILGVVQDGKSIPKVIPTDIHSRHQNWRFVACTRLPNSLPVLQSVSESEAKRSAVAFRWFLS